MDRIIIINGIPYICHKAYYMEIIDSNIKNNMEKNNKKAEPNSEEKSNPNLHDNGRIDSNYQMDENTSINRTSNVKVQTLNNIDKNTRSWNNLSINTSETKKYIFSVNSIVANMAKWIYYLDPINPNTNYPVHKIYISQILHLLYINLIKDCRTYTIPAYTDFYYFEYTKDELRKYLCYIVYDGPNTKRIFSKLNLSYIEINNKIEASDPNRDIINFYSRYSGPKWEDEFIDLDALINNVVRDCIKDADAVE